MTLIERSPVQNSSVLRRPVLYRPESAVFWLYVVSLATGIVVVLLQEGGNFGEAFGSQLAFAPFWLAFMTFLVWLMFKFDPYRSVRPYQQGLLAGTALGGTTAIALALVADDPFTAVVARYLDPDTFAIWISALRAPLIEELSKAMCAAVILVLCASVFNRLSHALLVGMFVGFGFDVVEDLVYSTHAAIGSLDSDFGGTFDTLLGRFIGALPAHWSYTALTAVAILLLLPSFRDRDRWPLSRRLPVSMSLFGCAWLMHFWNNAPLPENMLGAVLLLVKTPACLGILIVVAVLVQRNERRWVLARIADGRGTEPLAAVDPVVLDSLSTLKGRRRLRHDAKLAGGRAAKKSMAARQRQALDLVQGPTY
jgi:protease PrsW